MPVEISLATVAIAFAVLVLALHVEGILHRTPLGVFAVTNSLLHVTHPGQLSIGIPRRVCAGVGFVLTSGLIEAVRLLFQLGLVPRDLLLVRSEFGRRTPGAHDCSRRQQGEMKGFHVITIILFWVLVLLLVLQ